MLKNSLIAIALLLLAACAATPSHAPGATPQAERPKGVTLPDFDVVTLANGMDILLMEKHDVPMISFQAIVRGGAIADPPAKNGTAALLADLLRKGAGARDAREFAQAVESAGGVLNTAAGQEALIVSGGFMARDAGLMVELLGDLLMEPSLSKTEFDKLQERSIQQIKAMKDSNLRSLSAVYGDAFLFGDHPYGRAVIGSEAGLAKTGYADIRRYFIEQVGADRTILAVVGDFDTAAMRARLEKRFGGWRKAAGKLPVVEPLAPREGRRVLLVDKPDATQTYFYIGNVGVARDYENAAALELVNTVFGGQFTSMLNTKLRVESGLTYGAGSRSKRLTQPGSLAILSYTRTETTVEAIDMALATLESLHAGALSPEQLAAAKSYVLGQFPPELETAGDLAGRLAEIRFYGLGRDDVDEYAARISAVSLDDARRVVETVYPRSSDLTFVLIGNASAIRDQVAKYGPVTEMKITAPRFRP
ncbi:MAG TPA: pitrilysin family protein [Gammaproteobacteria bacterium]